MIIVRIIGEGLAMTNGESNIQVAASWQANKNILLKVSPYKLINIFQARAVNLCFLTTLLSFLKSTKH
jgi:hypothetical protein